MADFANCNTPDLLQSASDLFTGLRDQPDLLPDLADYEIELRDEVAEGLALIETLRTEIGAQTAESGDATRATAASADALAALEVGYVRHRKLARARYKRGSAEYRTLGLAGDVPDAHAQLIADADAFYAALSTSPALAEGIRGLTPKALAAAAARVDAARASETTQGREAGESQEATVRRRRTEARLRALSTDVATAAEDAFHDQPQRRERLGLFQRGSR